jgi:Methyltransferase FkbM domain
LFARKDKRPDRMYCILALAVTCAIVLLATADSLHLKNYVGNGDTNTDTDTNIVLSATTLQSELLSNFDKEDNARMIKLLRKKIREQCDTATSASDLQKISPNEIGGFTLNLPNDDIPKVAVRDNSNVIQRCKNVVIDLGANIGDTFGHVIDSGMISCDRTGDLGAYTLQSHFNVVRKQFESVTKVNAFTTHIQQLMTKVKPDQGPEDYCYYGIEGNPYFTERLQKLEDSVMAINPRPVQHAHFFTESVGSGEDGMTKLYLDTVNVHRNFWGSSILKDHPDVIQSAKGKDVESLAAPVMGYTLGTLMRMTLKALDPKASEQDKKGSHFILKMDIEGGEYPLIREAIVNGTLCEFVALGNNVDTIIEYHDPDFDTKEMMDALKNCGVNMGILDDIWS